MLKRRTIQFLLVAAVFSSAAAVAQTSTAPRVQAIRFWSFGDVTRVAIQTEGEYRLRSDQIENPPRLYFDLNGLRPPANAKHGVETIQVGDHRVKEIRVAPVSAGITRIVFDLETPVEVVSSQLVNPDRLIIEIRPKGTSLAALAVPHTVTGAQVADPGTTTAAVETPVRNPVSIPPPPPSASTPPALTPSTTPPAEKPAIQKPLIVPPAPNSGGIAAPAKQNSSGERSLVRVFGLKIGKVVIDAGHGGHDTGTIGPGGLYEKDLVLDVALRLGALVTRKLGAEVVYTRSDDTFIPLEQRTKIANEQKADLFISIHANASPEPSATGVETYYFNLSSDKRGLDLATRENATASSSVSDLNDLLHRAVLQTKLEESRDFAQQVQNSLWPMSTRMNNRAKDRGVRQAPFVVLIGATMPSILAEVGFVSNPHDERLLRRSEQRQKIADAVYKGVSQYVSSLSHVQMARAAQ
ncbi:MAG: N-acetylmuramoyl-L-alanine amidase [Acidobacteriaceae bacterium]|nr:N-acetylmuramoyl-L-alanine amidase [Acidobacteriaceae bacterium]